MSLNNLRFHKSHLGRMTTKTKKQKQKKSLHCDPGFASQWANSDIDLCKSPQKLLKVFQKKSESQASDPQSPLTWFVNELHDSEAIKTIDFWYRRQMSQADLCELFLDVRDFVEELTRANDSTNQNTSHPDSSRDGLGVGTALTAVGACHSLRTVAGFGPLMEWNGMVAQLLDLATAAAADLDLAPAVYQVLAIEAPLTVAFQFPEIEDHRQLAIRCCQKLTDSLEDKLDHDGWPHARYLDEFGLLAASWVRCGLLLKKMGVELESDSESQLEWVVRQLIRVTGPDGRPLFFSGDERPWGDSLALCLKRLSGDDDDKKLLKLRRPSTAVERKKAKSGKSKSDKASPKKLPATSCLSEWADSGVLRSHWGAGSPLVGLDYSSSSIRMSIARSVNLISGKAMPEITINSKSVKAESELEVVCEQSDADVEYVELETDLGEGAVFNRQILLSRDEEFLLVADVVVPQQSSRIEYRCDYRLAPGIVGLQETENREIYLRTDEIQALVLPLALPEWKVDRCNDRLEFDQDKLTLTQTLGGRGLYAPLFFDLNPLRSRKKRTWRQLTVGENLKTVPRDVAGAYRVQLDEQQWCFYRAISNPGNRTFLGENVNDEFVFNRFKKNGSVTPLIRI